MNNYKETLKALLQDESGQDLIEYALVAGLIGVAAIAGMTAIGTNIKNVWGQISNNLTNA